MLSKHAKYENQIFENLSGTLSNLGWTLKRHYRQSNYHYDLALFHQDIFCTFIEIKYSKKKSFSLIKRSSENQIRNFYLQDIFNFGILFINGKLFIVSRNNSKEIKSFPNVSSYEWRKDNTGPILSTSTEDEDYDDDSIPVYRALFDEERKKNEVLQKELKKEKQKKNLYKNLFFNNIKYYRESIAEKELKIKLLNEDFLQFIKSSSDGDLKNDDDYNNWCDRWDILESNSKKFIRESENLYKYLLDDYTPYVHGFAKALENEILIKVFKNFLEYFTKNKIDIDYQITDKVNSGTIKVFRNFLKRENLDSFLSLDKMRFIISAIFSKTNDKLLLEFRPVYLNYFKKMRNIFAKGGNVDKLKIIRNLGAHTKPIDKKVAKKFYEIFKSTFNKIMNNYILDK